MESTLHFGNYRNIADTLCVIATATPTGLVILDFLVFYSAIIGRYEIFFIINIRDLSRPISDHPR